MTRTEAFGSDPWLKLSKPVCLSKPDCPSGKQADESLLLHRSFKEDHHWIHIPCPEQPLPHASTSSIFMVETRTGIGATNGADTALALTESALERQSVHINIATHCIIAIVNGFLRSDVIILLCLD